MSDHYYSSKPSSAHQLQTFTTTLKGRSYTFVSDAGVFSKKGVDFGSRLLVETMEIAKQAHVLDVGCGYGVIGIAAAGEAVQGMATLLDINERAVELARENAKRNQVRNVEVIHSDLLEGVQGRNFDCILTNPPIRAGKETVHRIFEQAHAALRSEGSLWVVIQKNKGPLRLGRSSKACLIRWSWQRRIKGIGLSDAVKQSNAAVMQRNTPGGLASFLD